MHDGPDDNDNFAFANNAIRWLGEGPPDGKPHTRRSSSSMARSSRTSTEANRTVAADSDNRRAGDQSAVQGWRRIASFRRSWRTRWAEHGPIHRGGVGIVTFLVLLYGAEEFLEGRSHLETAVPALLGPPPTGNAPNEQRQQAVMRKADFGSGAGSRRMGCASNRGPPTLARGHRCEV